MTPLDSKIRLTLYVLIAMVSAAMAGIVSVDFSDRKQVVIFALAILAAGLNTARSYIDKSPTEIVPPLKTP